MGLGDITTVRRSSRNATLEDIEVGIEEAYGELETEVPSIVIRSGDAFLLLTWQEARDLALAIQVTEEVARCG